MVMIGETQKKRINMLITIENQTNNTNLWDRLQQPVHGSSHQADTLCLLAALDEGWQIQESASYLAHGNNAEGRGYLLTLYHPKRRLTHEWNVASSSDMDALLAFEGVL
jgi:hypothetical protein